MQTTTSTSQKTPAATSVRATIPADILQRLENEWRQVRQPAAPTTSVK
jgi:hypothetical protein